jgi:hypothetical protein
MGMFRSRRYDKASASFRKYFVFTSQTSNTVTATRDAFIIKLLPALYDTIVLPGLMMYAANMLKQGSIPNRLLTFAAITPVIITGTTDF